MPGMGGQKYTDVPINIVGSNKFGRYPWQSSEQTFNMIASDGTLCPFGGYRRVVQVNDNGKGRGIYSSNKLNKMFAVIDNGIYVFDTALTKTLVGNTTTTTGDIFISENNGGQVAFSDSENLYIYDNATNTILPILTNAALGFRPGYLTYQNGRFISPDLDSNNWRLSNENKGGTVADWPYDSKHVGAIQTKPDTSVACIRFPGRGNLLLAFGETVAEHWTDMGLNLFPYQRSQNTNLDYGCLNPATIAESENHVCWLAVNEKSGPTIMYTDGGEINHLSTDGIDFKLANLTAPADSYGYMLMLDGHLFYVITFVTDKLTYAYDFNAKAFYTLTDENLSYFIPKRVAFFNDQYYFVSINDGNLYQLGTQFDTYDYGDGDVREIPRIRIISEIRQPDQSYFVAGYTGFKVESNMTSTPQTVELSVSKDSGVTFGTIQPINLPGNRINRLMWWNLGMSNTLTLQFRFYGLNRFLAVDGLVGIYQ